MAVAGKNGKVVVGASASKKVVGIRIVVLELSLDTLETTALGDDWKNYITGTQKSGRHRARATTKYPWIPKGRKHCRMHSSTVLR